MSTRNLNIPSYAEKDMIETYLRSKSFQNIIRNNVSLIKTMKEFMNDINLDYDDSDLTVDIELCCTCKYNLSCVEYIEKIFKDENFKNTVKKNESLHSDLKNCFLLIKTEEKKPCFCKKKMFSVEENYSPAVKPNIKSISSEFKNSNSAGEKEKMIQPGKKCVTVVIVDSESGKFAMEVFPVYKFKDFNEESKDPEEKSDFKYPSCPDAGFKFPTWYISITDCIPERKFLNIISKRLYRIGIRLKENYTYIKCKNSFNHKQNIQYLTFYIDKFRTFDKLDHPKYASSVHPLSIGIYIDDSFEKLIYKNKIAYNFCMFSASFINEESCIIYGSSEILNWYLDKQNY
jgi:hypothetical protein